MKYCSITDIGNERKVNEDYYYTDNQKKKLFIVADGMGGHNAGDVASKMAVNIVKNSCLEKIDDSMSFDEIQQIIDQAVEYANKKIYKASKKFDELNGMGTTLLVAYLNHEEVYFVNVGDSRGYILFDDVIKQVTVDHSLVEELAMNGDISPEEVENHPQKNIITSCLGAKKEYKIDYYRFPKKEGMKLILCTDGLTGLVSDQRIYEIIKNNDFYLSSKLLIDEAKDNGGFDNITLIMIEV